MEIIIGHNAGFCFGVSKAINHLFDRLAQTDERLFTIGPIIHNDQVVERLEAKGVNVIDSIYQAPEGSHLIIRTHGVPSRLYEEMQKAGYAFTDLTCPYVKKIHKLVNEKYKDGYQIIIIGDKKHPEVIGINGWCGNSAYIVETTEDADKLDILSVKCCVVAQTTLTAEKWDKINEILSLKCPQIEKYNTICNATGSRQNEAIEIAQTVDMMVIIGGKSSSNTRKLYEICKQLCDNTYMVETADELPSVDIKRVKRIGVTAGASTPDWIIKEAMKKMDELYRQENEESFKDAFESTFKTLQNGDVIKGRVVGFNNSEVYVDIGYKSDGVIPAEHFTDVSGKSIAESVKVGDEVEAAVVRVNDGEGIVNLSKKRVDAHKSWDVIEKAFETKEPLSVKVTQVVNGGVVATLNGIRVFIPASQIGERYVKELDGYVNQVINVRIIDFDKQKKKIVASQRVLLMEEREAKANNFWGSIEAGKKYTGAVKSLTDFGAFVDIGGVDGLIHMSELSWSKIKHPSEVVKVGDQVEVYILEFDRERNRISLGYKKTEDNPWTRIEEKYPVGSVVKGKVVRLVPFGAFVELEKGVDALVHISQISNMRIAKPGDVLTIGQEVEAKVTDVNAESKKIGLSIKEVNPIDPKRAQNESENPDGEETPAEHKESMTNTIGEIVTND